MNESAQTINVVSIMGNDYSIKAPAGQERVLAEAVRMLKTSLADTKRSYPSLIGDKLLVLAALNLCSQQIALQQAHQQTLDRYQEQVSATVEAISQAIDNA
ncbi:cell division protein ZapA [Pseudomonas japonica]|uniref:cell division protein ZapA n=1 Tax=Pseudomonas TaxID=286 RepID=UPI0029297194|nr:cell division protein ZapA [Pseudomonas sp. zfem002]MDU9389472.1 cell division protein ZapA [Pseudomonas sp. zfem002]